jgi:hypothetical protein
VVELVEKVALHWKRGLGFRKACRILRRHGIHPWSMLVPLESPDRARLAEAFRCPDWVVDALSQESEGFESGFTFQNLPKGAVIPEGLACLILEVKDCDRIRRLPRRVWANVFWVENCARLEEISLGASHVRWVHVDHCPKLRKLLDGAGQAQVVDIRDCPSLVEMSLSTRVYNLEISSAPRLSGIRPHLRLKRLRIWSCPSLEGLETITVTESLEIHGCRRARSMPRMQGKVRAWVRDCPGIRPFEKLTPDIDLRFEAGHGPNALPPVQAHGGVQRVEAPLLFRVLDLEALSFWPWPPLDPGPDPLDRKVHRLLESLGYSLHERLRIQAKTSSVRTLCRFLLASAPDPGQAARLASRLAEEAGRAKDLPFLQDLLLEMEVLGLGALSAATPLGLLEMYGSTGSLNPVWIPAVQGKASLESIWSELGVIEGPLVWVGSERVQREVAIRSLEGPLWVEGDLEIHDCPDLEGLPDVLVVRGNLTLADCPALRRFPKILEVQGDLSLKALPRIGRATCLARVGGRIRVEGVPGLSFHAPGTEGFQTA